MRAQYRDAVARRTDQLRLLDELLETRGQELLASLPLPGEPLTAAGELRLGAELRARWPADLVAAALAQRELRALARAKFRLAARMLFTSGDSVIGGVDM